MGRVAARQQSLEPTGTDGSVEDSRCIQGVECAAWVGVWVVDPERGSRPTRSCCRLAANGGGVRVQWMADQR